MFSQLLLNWYRENYRPLPWRVKKYTDQNERIFHTWICEVMSQQTVLKVVLPKFEKFISEIKNLSELAHCSEEKLRLLWQGLGYYARARNLQKGAQYLLKEQCGDFPLSYEEWLKVPGCGPYTAAVICSICLGEGVPSIDGNVMRVVSRLKCLKDDAWTGSGKKIIQKFLDEHIPKDFPGDFNQAMMDLGATVCKKQNPQCDVCPVQKYCMAFQKKCVALCPSVKPRRTFVTENIYALLLEHKGQYLTHTRAQGFLAQTRGFPLCRDHPEHIPLPALEKKLKGHGLNFVLAPEKTSHTITHHKLTVHRLQVTLPTNQNLWPSIFRDLSVSQDFEFVSPKQFSDKISSSLDLKVSAILKI